MPARKTALLGQALDGSQPGAKLGFSVVFYERRLSGLYFGSLIVGAPCFDDGLVDQGEVFGFLSDGNGMPMLPNWKVKGGKNNANFGYSLAVAQPFDSEGNSIDSEGNPINTLQGDIFADLIVGEPNYDADDFIGRVSVYYGTDSGLGADYRSADKTYLGTIAGGHLGWSVAAGDVNKDGFQDVLASQPDYGAGVVYLYKGSSTGLPTSSSGSISGSQSGEQFGFSVAFAGDVNGNADADQVVRHDIIVGAPLYNNSTFTDAGKVYLFNGTPTGLASTPYWTDTVSQTGAKLGYSVWGDINVDNVNLRDIVAGIPFYDGLTTDEGRVHVYRSNGSGNPQAPDVLETPGHQAGARLGFAVCGGRVNINSCEGAGCDPFDIIAGAPYYDINTNDDKGKVFVFWGRHSQAPLPTPHEVWSFQSTMTGEHFGSSVAYIRKITSPLDNACIAGGAPEANPSGVANAGLVMVWEWDDIP